MVKQCFHVTLFFCGYFNMSLCLRATTSPNGRIVVKQFFPFNRILVPPYHQVNMLPCLLDRMSPIYRFHVSPCNLHSLPAYHNASISPGNNLTHLATIQPCHHADGTWCHHTTLYHAKTHLTQLSTMSLCQHVSGTQWQHSSLPPNCWHNFHHMTVPLDTRYTWPTSHRATTHLPNLPLFLGSKNMPRS